MGMDQKVRWLVMVMMAWGSRRWWSVAAWGLRKIVDVAVMFERVNVRMRVGRVGKRIYRVVCFIWRVWRRRRL